MSEKVGPFIYQSRKIGSVIYFLSKKGGQSYTWHRWKREPFGTHIHTMPYIGSYPPPPLPPQTHTHNPPRLNVVNVRKLLICEQKGQNSISEIASCILKNDSGVLSVKTTYCLSALCNRIYVVEFPPVFTKKHVFVTSCLLSAHHASSKKGSTVKKRNMHPQRSNSFLLK